jgi:Leu/Phe-tRNA-protein transferase
MNYEGLQNQRQNIRKYFSTKNTFSTDSFVNTYPTGVFPAFHYDTQPVA